MKRKRFTEEQIIGILKEHELGAKTAEVCRKHGVSEATFYKWKSKYGGMEVSEAKRLKALDNPPKSEPDRRRREKDVGDLRSGRAGGCLDCVCPGW